MQPRDPAVIIQQLVALLRRHIELIVIPLVLFVIGGAVVYKVLPRKYKSVSKLLVEAQASGPDGVLNKYASSSQVNRRINLLINIMLSRKVLGQMAEYIAKQEGKTLNSSQRYLSIIGLRGRIQILNLGQGLVQLGYTCRVAEKCYDHLNYLFKIFLQETINPQQESIRRSSRFLSKQLERLKQRLKNSERALTLYKKQNNLDLPSSYKATFSTYMLLRKELAKSQLELATATRRRDVVQRQIQLLDPKLLQLRNQVLEMLTVQRRLTSLKSRYTDRHPRVRRAERRLRSLRRSIQNAKLTSTKSLFQLRNSMAWERNFGKNKKAAQNASAAFQALQEILIKISVLDKQIAENKTQLKVYKKRLAQFPVREQRLAELKREVDIARATYAKLRTLQEQALLRRELEVFDASRRVQVIEPPMIPMFPTSPRLIFVAAGALMASFGLSLLLILLAELFYPSFHSEEQAARVLEAEVLGEVDTLRPIDL